MIGCLWTCVRKQPIIALYFESETVLKFYNLEARFFKRYIKIHNKALTSTGCLNNISITTAGIYINSD